MYDMWISSVVSFPLASSGLLKTGLSGEYGDPVSGERPVRLKALAEAGKRCRIILLDTPLVKHFVR
jgi:hypothetical protein